MSLGKNSTFLNAFWDLASDEREKRVAAACSIIEHVKNESGSGVDTEYALKRLVRGLGSSRESARQGFVTCLCELLITVPSIALGTTMTLIDDNTKITGSMKGSEERDLMFGKLFGYLSVIRSGKLGSDEENVTLIMDKLLELHNRKGWIREVVCESILTLLSALQEDMIRVILPKVKTLLGDGQVLLSDMTAWQLMLCVGIQQLAAAKAITPSSLTALKQEKEGEEDVEGSLSEQLLQLLPVSDVVTPGTFKEMIPTLLEATAGFPKMHRVWDSVISAVYPMDASRALPRKRPASLSQRQEEMLNTFCSFVDKYLLPASVEKRSVALKLCVELVRLSPAEMIPTACSNPLVKCLFACRVNRKHVLYALAGSVLQELVAAVGTQTECRLALASCLVQYGGANFDAQTGTRAVSTLLEGLGAEEVASHVRFLCGVLGTSLSATATRSDLLTNGAAGMRVVGEGDAQEEDDEGLINDSVASASGTIEALSSLVRNTRLANRAYVCSAIVGVFVRLSCFGKGNTQLPAETKAPKRKSKKDKEQAVFPSLSPMSRGVVDAVKLVEGSSSSSGSFHVSSEIAELASAKLMAILADTGNLSLVQLDTPAPPSDGKRKGGDKKDKEKDSTMVVDGSGADPRSLSHSTLLIDVAVATVEYLSTTGGLSLLRASEGEDEEDDEEGEEVGGVSDAQTAFSNALTAMKSLTPTSAPSLTFTPSPATPSALTVKGSGKTDKAVVPSGSASDVATDSDASSSTEGVGKSRLRDSFYSLLGHSIFHTLTSSAVSMQALHDLADVSVRIVEQSGNEVDSDVPQAESSGAVKKTVTKKTTKKDEDENDDEEDDDEVDDDDDEEDRPQSTLFDASMELLSVSGDHAVKGVRDAIKRVWNSLCQVCEVDSDVIDAALSAVMADDGEEEPTVEERKEKKKIEKGEKRKRIDFEDAHNHEEEDEDEEEGDEDKEDEEEEDEVLVGDQALDFLSTDFGMEDGEEDDDDEGMSSKAMKHMALQHSEEADSALVQLLALRRQSRKKGLLEAQRGQLLIRSRAIDILDILVHREESSSTLLPLYLPLLRTLKKLQSSATYQSLQEGRALEQRLRILLEQKMCKKKFQLITDGVDSLSSTDAEEMEAEREEIEASSSDMREEVAALMTEVFKCLSSPIPALRPVGLSVLLCITRAAVSTPNTDSYCRSLLSSSLQSAFADFTSKKHSRLAPKIFEEIIQRFPDFCVGSFLPDLISSCGGAKTSFLRAECCRFFCEILKRHKSLLPGSSDILSSSLERIVTTLGDAIAFNIFSSPSSSSLVVTEVVVPSAETGKKSKKSKKEVVEVSTVSKEVEVPSSGKALVAVSGEREKETRAKRLKPLLLCAKELALLLKFPVTATQEKDSQHEKGGGEGKVKAAALKQLLGVMQSEGVSCNTNSPAVIRMVDQVVQLLTAGVASSSSVADEKKEKENGKVAKDKTKAADKALAAVEMNGKSNKKEKAEKKPKKEGREDKMVTSVGQTEQEDGEEPLPIGEYVEAGAKGPKFKNKKGGKKEAKEDQQEMLDAAENQLIRRMHDDKRSRGEADEVERDVDVEKKRKWHE